MIFGWWRWTPAARLLAAPVRDHEHLAQDPGVADLRGVLVIMPGRGWAWSGPTSGCVVSVHRRAAYLRLDGGLVALVGPGVDAGPVHVRCSALPPVTPGEAVRCDGQRLAGRSWALRVDGSVWRGELPSPGALAARAGDAAVRDAMIAEASTLSGFAGIEAFAAAVGGRGEGLTPSGDDLLAGVLVVASLVLPAERVAAVASGVDTTEVARAFLHWAARGQTIAPAHDWLAAVAAADATGARRARERLHAVGASSGRWLAAGLALGVAALPE